MDNMLSKLNWDETVLLDRRELSKLTTILTKKSERSKLAAKIFKRAEKMDKKYSKHCKSVLVKVWEIKILFPDYETNPPIWR